MNRRSAIIEWRRGAPILVGVLGLLVWGGGALAETLDRAVSTEDAQVLREVKRIYVDVSFSTWMPRGHTLADVAPVIRTRLIKAGFTVVREKKESHDLLMTVDYREEQGREIRFDYYGTDITGVFKVEHPTLGPLLGFTVQASSPYPPTGAAPYLDALHRFDTNPYYFLIGDIVAEKVRQGSDLTGGLVRGVTRLSGEQSTAGDPSAGTHTMQSGDTFYGPAALVNAIAELERIKDPRAVPAFTAALQHYDPKVRAKAVGALGQVGTAEAKPAVEALLAREQDPSVQEAGAAALKRLNTADAKTP